MFHNEVDPQVIELLLRYVDFSTDDSALTQFDDFLAQANEKGHKPISAFFRLKDASTEPLSLGTLLGIAERYGYQPGWAWHQYALGIAAKSSGNSKPTPAPKPTTRPIIRAVTPVVDQSYYEAGDSQVSQEFADIPF